VFLMYALLWALAGAMAFYTWWCYVAGEISSHSITVTREDHPRAFEICIVLLGLGSLVIAAIALKYTLAAL